MGIEERAAVLGKRSIKTTAKQQGIRLAVSMVDLTATIDELAAESVTRVRHAAPTTSYEAAVADGQSRLEAVTELKTAWHPIGA